MPRLSVGEHLLTNSFTSTGSIQNFADQLTTGSIYIVTAGFSDGRNQAAFHDNFLEAVDSLIRRTAECRAWKRVKRYEVEFAGKAPEQFNQFPGMFRMVIDSVN
jgi:hypothetical protein